MNKRYYHYRNHRPHLMHFNVHTNSLVASSKETPNLLKSPAFFK